MKVLISRFAFVKQFERLQDQNTNTPNDYYVLLYVLKIKYFLRLNNHNKIVVINFKTLNPLFF